VHCVALHLDVSVCVKRATERSDHEGGLQVCNASIECPADPECISRASKTLARIAS
jgi:hypothetical protein